MNESKSHPIDKGLEDSKYGKKRLKIIDSYYIYYKVHPHFS